MVGVVGDVEAEAGEGEAEGDRQQPGLPPGAGGEHQEGPRGDDPDEHRRALEVHPHLGAAHATAVLEVQPHPRLQLVVEGPATLEVDP